MSKRFIPCVASVDDLGLVMRSGGRITSVPMVTSVMGSLVSVVCMFR